MLNRCWIPLTIVFFAYMLKDATADNIYHSDFKKWKSWRICNDDYEWSKDGICNWVSSNSKGSCDEKTTVELIDDDDEDHDYFGDEYLSEYGYTILTCRNSKGQLKGCACAGKDPNGVIKFEGKTKDGVVKCKNPGTEKIMGQ